MRALLLALCLGSLGCDTAPIDPEDEPPAQPAATMTRYVIDQARHPQARCNDGTTPVFYHRRGVGDGVDKWVLWFKGGGSCWSEASCADRGQNLMSATPWMHDDLMELATKGNDASTDGSAGGILSPDPEVNPDFYTWNHVYMVYCSSDNWAGTRPPSAQTGNLHFAGHYITDAIMDALQDPTRIGTSTLREATQILLTGSSAGAGGGAT